MNAMTSVAPTIEQCRFETERQLVGALLQLGRSAAVKAVADIVKPEHFSDLSMARLFYLLKELSAADLDGTALTMGLLQKLQGDAPFLAQDKITPQGLIGHCVAYSGPPIALPALARLVKFQALSVLLDNATEQGDLAAVQSLGAEMEALDRAQFNPSTAFEPIGSVVEKVLTELNLAYQTETPTKDYADAGISSVGKMIGGWRRKRFYIIAGRPGMGKTTFSLSALVRTASAGHGVLLNSLEMGAGELTEMALCDLAWTKSSRIEYRDISANAVHLDGFAAKYDEIMQVAPLLRSMPFFINDKGGLTIADIRTQALDYAQRLAAQGRRLDVVAVDHLGLIKPTGNYRGNKVAETEEVSASLKQLAKELDCAVIALCQLSRQTEGREDKRPTLADLRWSGGIEQDADCVMMAYREEYYLKKADPDSEKEHARLAKLDKVQNTMSIFIEKQRGGPTGEIKLFCDVGCAVVRNLDTGAWHG